MVRVDRLDVLRQKSEGVRRERRILAADISVAHEVITDAGNDQ